jgi:uncharacterized repeat protein (TIGR01451 family)
MNPGINCRVSCAFAVLAASVATVVFATGASAQTSPAEFARAWDLGVPTTVIGTVTVIRTDDFVRQQSGLVHMIRDEGTGESFHLRFESDRPTNLRSGLRVQVRGRRSGSGVYGPELLIAGCCDGSEIGAIAPRSIGAASLPSGDQRTLVMLANFKDAAVSCSADAVNNAMFADPTGLSVNGLYQASSFGRVSFSGQVVGPYALAASSTDTCNMSGWADAADAQAAASGLDVASYPRKVYVMPLNTCPGAGMGTVGSVDSSRAWIFACDTKGVFAHEVGHNLGMDHASTPTQEYGDNTDPMSIATWMLHGVNAPHRLALGWFGSTDTLLVTTTGLFDVAPLAVDPARATAPRALMIAKPDTLEYYYVSYRTPIGADSYIDGSYYYRLSIHRYRSDGTLARTFLLAGLADGESVVDSVNGITVTMVAHDDAHATARIEFASPTCVQSAPSISVSPQAQVAPPGSTVSYTVSVTNRDAAACPASSFSLSDVVPAGWTTAVSPASLTLGSGATGQAVVTVTSPSAAAAGTYNATINSSRPTSTNPTSATATYTVQAPQDTTAPSTPTRLNASANQKLKQIELSWTAVTDNVGVAGYRVSRDGVIIGTSPSTGFIDPTWTSGATYSYSVVAFDAAGNVSQPATTSITVPRGNRR